MYLTGYHGTSEKWAKKVLETHTFKISDGDKEWLGRGIYFYESFGDAYAWNNSEVILHSVIKINDDEYVDFDTDDGADLYNRIEEYICANNSITIDKKSKQKNQCAIINMLWDMCPTIKAMSSSFAKEKTLIPALMDKRKRRREFCVRSNDYIIHTYPIKKSDIDE